MKVAARFPTPASAAEQTSSARSCSTPLPDWRLSGCRTPACPSDQHFALENGLGQHLCHLLRIRSIDHLLEFKPHPGHAGEQRCRLSELSDDSLFCASPLPISASNGPKVSSSGPTGPPALWSIAGAWSLFISALADFTSESDNA